MEKQSKADPPVKRNIPNPNQQQYITMYKWIYSFIVLSGKARKIKRPKIVFKTGRQIQKQPHV